MNVTRGTYPGFVTAQYRGSEQETSGFVFRAGSVRGSGEVCLGRAWGPYSRVIFYGTYFSTVVSPQGWDAWSYVGQEYVHFFQKKFIGIIRKIIIIVVVSYSLNFMTNSRLK